RQGASPTATSQVLLESGDAEDGVGGAVAAIISYMDPAASNRRRISAQGLLTVSPLAEATSTLVKSAPCVQARAKRLPLITASTNTALVSLVSRRSARSTVAPVSLAEVKSAAKNNPS